MESGLRFDVGGNRPRWVAAGGCLRQRGIVPQECRQCFARRNDEDAIHRSLNSSKGCRELRYPTCYC